VGAENGAGQKPGERERELSESGARAEREQSSERRSPKTIERERSEKRRVVDRAGTQRRAGSNVRTRSAQT